MIAVNYLGNCLSGEFRQYQNSYILFNVSSKTEVLFYRYSVLESFFIKNGSLKKGGKREYYPQPGTFCNAYYCALSSSRRLCTKLQSDRKALQDTECGW